MRFSADDVASSDPAGPDETEESEVSWIERLRERLARSSQATQSYLDRYASDHHLLVARHDELCALLHAKDEQLAEQNALITTMRSRLLDLELQMTGPRDATDFAAEFRLTPTEQADLLAFSRKAKLPRHVATSAIFWTRSQAVKAGAFQRGE
ncbi:hypothetical protein E5Q_01201, partial [Mixia osmundae IAM 14324]